MPRNLKRSEAITLFEPHRNNNVWEVIKTLVNGGTDESRLLELYYWSQEPGVIEMIRAYLEMDERARLSLANFMLTVRPTSIVATHEANGHLVLSQGETAKSRAERRLASDH